MEVLVDRFDVFASGLWVTVQVCLLAAIGALVLGTVAAVLRISPVPPLRAVGTGYVTVFRNMPLTVVSVFVAFGLPQLGSDASFLKIPVLDRAFPRLAIDLPYFRFFVIALSLYTGAFVCEALRAGINAVPAGQAEAARALGLSFGQTLRTVVLPQAFRTVVPPLGNVWIALAKNTSIAAGFAVTDLAAALQRLANQNADQLLTVFLAIVVAYLIITLPSAWLIGVIERRTAILR